jgi:RNA polymerase sigma-70 factor (ECF subfamily)
MAARLNLHLEIDGRARPAFSIDSGSSGHEQDVLAFHLVPTPSESSRHRGASTTVDAPLPRGDARARRFRRLVREHFDFVWRTVRRFGVAPADADDAAQEVFLVACRRLDGIVPERERAFLFGTSVRVASTRRRSAARRNEAPEADLERVAALELDPEQLAELAAARAVLQRILDGMNDDVRAVFVLAELEELPTHEIAALLAIPAGTVSSRLRSAREAFRSAVARLAAKEKFERTK